MAAHVRFRRKAERGPPSWNDRSPAEVQYAATQTDDPRRDARRHFANALALISDVDLGWSVILFGQSAPLVSVHGAG